jgi:hypothetical protein
MIENILNLLPQMTEIVFIPSAILFTSVLMFVFIRSFLRGISFILGRKYPNQSHLKLSRCGMSLLFISERQKGFIFNGKNIILPKLLRFYSKFWVVKLNNEHESSVFYNDGFCKISDINNFIISSKKNHPNNTEFWVQPYVDSKCYGTINSHAKSDFSQISINFSNIEESKLRDCSNLSSRWENKLVSTLKKAEKEYNKPLTIHFALTKNKAIILEVKEQPLTENQDDKQFLLARNFKGNISRISNHSYMGTSVLFMLLNSTKFLYGQKTLSINHNNISQTLSIDDAFDRLIAVKESPRYIYSELSVTIRDLSIIIDEILQCKITASVDHISILSDINKHFYSPSATIDICSKETLYFDELINSYSSQEDCMDFVIYIAINVIKEKMIQQDIMTGSRNFDVRRISGISMKSFIEGVRK